MKRCLLVIAIVALMAAASCSTKDTASVKKDMCVQMYSARSILTHENYADLLKQIAAMGYTAVETASYDGEKGLIYGDTPEVFRQKVEAAGMKVLSAHVSRGLSREELDSGDLSAALQWWDKCIDVHVRAGMKYLVTPWMGLQSSLHDLQVYCDYLNEVGRRCKAAGLQYGYHNHAYEFEKVEGEVMYDYLLDHTDPELVFFQMDVYWAVIGKASPVDYFERYPGRFTVLHVKDEWEVGQSGMVGFDAIFKNAELAGMQDFVVEIERYRHEDILVSFQESADYLLNAPFVKASYADDALQAEPNTLTAKEKAEGWELLFDGKTMKGWRDFNGKGLTGPWTVEDGAIRAEGEGDDGNGYIVTEREFADFHLKWEWKISRGGNSGMLYHVVEGPQYDVPYVTGPEYQIIDDENWEEVNGFALEPWQRCAVDYAMYVPDFDKRILKPAGEWNRSEIIFDKGRVTYILNGKVTVAFEAWTKDWYARKDSGKWENAPDYGLARKGHICLQDHGYPAWFRNIKVKPLP